MAGLATAVVVALGAVGWIMDGFPLRYSAQQLRVAQYLSYSSVSMFRTDQGCFIFDKGPKAWD